jgi:hypothetical protein
VAQEKNLITPGMAVFLLQPQSKIFKKKIAAKEVTASSTGKSNKI